MKIHRYRFLRLFFLLLLLSPATVASLGAADFSQYQNYGELTEALRELASQFPDLVKLEEIGQSAGGRSLWVVEVANRAGTPVSGRPALLVAANFEGTQVVGSQVVLTAVNRLLGNYESEERVREILDRYVIYVLPRANPDGAEHMFADVKTGYRTNSRPYDDDNDGRTDEDGPEDLNGDGLITVMRVKDPDGPFMVHPEDSRLMKKADPTRGEVGEYQIYWEGIDDDGDGFLNEDPAGGVDLNRNFQHQYPYYSVDAGPHMVSEPESRAILDWILDHKNIGIILTFGESDNLAAPPDSKGKLGPESRIGLLEFADSSNVESRTEGMFELEDGGLPWFLRRFDRGDSAEEEGGRPRRPPRRPEVDVNGKDLPYFKAVSDRYREITGIETTPAIRTPAGAFFEYGYFQYGVLSFSTPGWGLTQASVEESSLEADSPMTEEDSSAQRGGSSKRAGGAPPTRSGPRLRESGGEAEIDLNLIRWMDGQEIGGFVPWEEFEHSELGPVEIGGFRPYAVTNPPAGQIEELAEEHEEFIRYLTSLFPRISIAESEVENLGGGLFRIRAEVENSGFLPTALAHGEVSHTVKPTMVQLGIEPRDLVSGDAKTSFFQGLNGSGNRKSFEWIFRGETGTEVVLRVISQKGGSESVALLLQ